MGGDGEYGSFVEILACSKVYTRSRNVFHSVDGKLVLMVDIPCAKSEKPPISLFFILLWSTINI